MSLLVIFDLLIYISPSLVIGRIGTMVSFSFFFLFFWYGFLVPL